MCETATLKRPIILNAGQNIAEYSTWSILQYFRPSFSYQLRLRSFLSIFEWLFYTGFTVYENNTKDTHHNICLQIIKQYIYIFWLTYIISLFAYICCGGCPSKHASRVGLSRDARASKDTRHNILRKTIK